MGSLQLKIIVFVAIFGVIGSGIWYIYHQGQLQARQEAENQGLRLGMEQYENALSRANTEAEAYRQASIVLSNQYMEAEKEASDAKQKLATMDFDNMDAVNDSLARLLSDTEDASRRFYSAGSGATPSHTTDTAESKAGKD